MPAKVIVAVHQFAACKKNKGIVFMDKDGNIINDDDHNDDHNDTLEITGVDTMNDEMCNTDNNTLEITQVSEDNTLEITGLFDDKAENTEESEVATETEICNNEHNIAQNMDSKLNEAGHNQDRDYEQYDDD